jgi:hypothetical protein
MPRRAIYLIEAIWLVCSSAWAGDRIHLKTRYLTESSYPASQALTAAGQRSRHLLVQFADVPGADTLRELRRRGARVVGAAPDGGLTISVGRPISLDNLGIQWAGPLLPEDKISPILTAGAASAGPGAVLVEFHPDVSRRRALALLRGRNLEVLWHPDLAPNHVLISAAPEALADLAGLDEVAYIFPASHDLEQGNRVMACSGAFTAQGPVGQYVTIGSGWGGAGADGVAELDYVFAQMSAKLPTASVQSEIMRALQEWAKYANLRFVPGSGTTGSRTISVMFAQGAHGDGYPFAPGSPVLAHTFFPAPPNPEPIAGDMHLNEDQSWHIGADIDLYTVALHEAGHALGLGHTDQPDDIMYPYYRMGKVLSSDDIAGIQALYGSRDTPTPPAATPVSLTISNPAAAAVTTTAATISMAGTASGGSGTLQITWSSDQGGAGQAIGSANWSIGAVPLNLGANGITVRATDSAGHAASALITVTRQSAPPPPPNPPSPPVTPPAPPATGPPSLSIVSPSLTIVSTSLATIAVSGTASGSVTAVKWANSTGSSGDAAGTSSWTAANIPLLVGTNAITVRAFDAAGDSAWRALTVVRQ